jgi:hypothetical protein
VSRAQHSLLSPRMTCNSTCTDSEVERRDLNVRRSSTETITRLKALRGT